MVQCRKIKENMSNYMFFYAILKYMNVNFEFNIAKLIQVIK